MEIVNKFFKRKASNDPAAKIVNVENGFAVFENGARCKVETLLSDFSMVEGVVEQKTQSQSVELNPDTFFDSPLNDPNLENQLKTIIDNPNVVLPKTIEDKPSVDLTANKVISKPNDITNRFSEEPVNYSQTQEVTNQSYPNPNVIQEPAEYKVFSNVKRTEEIDINIPFSIKLPKAQKVDVLNDMFESSFIEFLAKKEVETLLKDSKALTELIIDQLTDWLDTTLNGGKVKKKKKVIKPSNTSKPIKSKPIVQEKAKKVVKERIIEKIEVTTNIDDSFGRKQGMIVSDVPTEIKSEDDLARIEKHVAALYEKDFTPDVSAEITAYENTILLYKSTQTK